MKMKTRYLMVLSCALSVSLAALGSVAASATALSSSGEVGGGDAVVARGEGYVVVDASSEAVIEVDGAEFYPIDSLAEGDTIFVAENGILPDGRAVEQMEENPHVGAGNGGALARASRGYGALMGAWTGALQGDVAWGSKYTTYMNYTFSTVSPKSMIACGQGRGWYRGYNGSTFGLWAKWYGLGCTSTSNTAPRVASVPWTDVVANKQFKAAGANVYVTGYWS